MNVYYLASDPGRLTIQLGVWNQTQNAKEAVGQ